MEYREYKPDHRLAGYIECYWSAFAEKPPFQEKERLIPDGTIEVMFNFGDNYAQVNNDRTTEVKGSHIIGIRKKSLVISQTAKQDFFSVRFKWGGTYPFFRIPAHLFAVADRFYCSYKTMERRFNRVLGVSPVEFLKINRFNKAVLQMYSCTFNSLTDIAYCVGYYDQSHFIREFKQLTELSPGDFLKSQFTIVQVIQPALAERMSNLYNL